VAALAAMGRLRGPAAQPHQRARTP
jgi:hypothetical protein